MRSTPRLQSVAPARRASVAGRISSPQWRECVLVATQPYKSALMVREPMRQWTRGRVTLLGDAAHPTLPFLAQGACMAIEDGAMLARCLRETADAQQALRRFQDARVERTTRIVQGSAANTKRFHNPALASAEGAVEYVNREWNEARVRERYHWLFDYKFDQVPLPA